VNNQDDQRVFTSLNNDEIDEESPAGVNAIDVASLGNPCPEAQAWKNCELWSILWLNWLNPLMEKGSRKVLLISDMWKLDGGEVNTALTRRFELEWEKELQSGSPKLQRALSRIWGRTFMFGGVLRIVYDMSQFVGPMLLPDLIDTVKDPRSNPVDGYINAIIMFVAAVVGSIFFGMYYQVVQRVGRSVRSVVTAMIFKQAIYLTHTGKKGISEGRMVNMMTSDGEALDQVASYFHVLWSSPIVIIVCLVMLFNQLQGAAFAGVGSMLLLLPIQKKLASRLQSLNKETLLVTDKRTKITREVLNFINIVKMYVWEDSFENKIDKIRSEELVLIKSRMIINAFMVFLALSGPIIVSIVSFVVYTVLGNELTAKKAFTALSLFNLLRQPLAQMPQAINQVVSALVSIERLQALLVREKHRSEDELSPVDPSQPSVKIDNLSFDWGATAPDDPVFLSAEERKKLKQVAKKSKKSGAKKEQDGQALLGQDHLSDSNGPTRAEDKGQSRAISLRNINLHIKHGELVAVVGETGSGKSSLLAAILNQVPCVTPGGKVFAQGLVSYVPQQSWIFNATVKENILFGLPFDAARYARALNVSCLDSDLKLFGNGDATEIGEKGVNISGGQKQRVSLARAVYADTSLFLFDDPLSALDTHVAKAVFERCIKGWLDERKVTRVLVTNQLDFISLCDRVIMLKEGQIVGQGDFNSLRNDNAHFHAFVTAEGARDGDAAGQLQSAKDEKKSKKPAKDADSEPGLGFGEASGALIVDEDRAMGWVSADVVIRYTKAMGAGHGLWLAVLLFTGAEVTRVMTNFWTATWTEAANQASQPGSGDGKQALAVAVGTAFLEDVAGLAPRWAVELESSNSTNSKPFNNTYYMTIYSLLSLAQLLCTLGNQVMFAILSVHAAKTLHNQMYRTVVAAPMQFFHQTPLGRILNRFTKDIADVDTQLIFKVTIFGQAFLMLMGTMCSIVYITPTATFITVPVLIFFFFTFKYFQASSREIKRLDSITRSPIYSHFSQCLSGIASIRAYRAAGRLCDDYSLKIDTNIVVGLAGASAGNWLLIRLAFFGGLCVLASACSVVLFRESIAPADAGLALSSTLAVTFVLNMCVRSASNLENGFNSVERVLSFIDTKTQAPVDLSRPVPTQTPRALHVRERDEISNLSSSYMSDDHLAVKMEVPQKVWPSNGTLAFEQVTMRYREGAPLVLHGISFSLKSGQTVGVVGRTGAGKSSLFQCLYRLVDLQGGRIVIDGKDISKLPLDVTRRACAVIPQDPVLFSGTIRSNLDPFDEHSDEELNKALERAHLAAFVRDNLPEGLLSRVEESGSNFSVGQKQLLCLARALLRNAAIVALDEATAAVDPATDRLIQVTIRNEFKGATVLTIAHRLGTVIDCDRVLVLDKGRVQEDGSPHELLSNPDGVFTSMVEALGPAKAAQLRSQAREAIRD